MKTEENTKDLYTLIEYKRACDLFKQGITPFGVATKMHLRGSTAHVMWGVYNLKMMEAVKERELFELKPAHLKQFMRQYPPRVSENWRPTSTEQIAFKESANKWLKRQLA